MNRQIPWNAMLWSGTAIMLVAGLLLSVSTVRMMRDFNDTMPQFRNDFATLRHLESRKVRAETALHAVEAMAGTNAVTPLAVFREGFPGARSELVRDERKDVIPGWVSRSLQMTVLDVALEEFPPLIRTLEQQRPPWRLRRVKLDGSPRGAGFGRMELTFEILERGNG